METKIYVYNGWVNIKPEDPIKSTRRLTSFCVFNCLRNALMKSQGGWYILHKDGRLELLARTLYLISFQEIYDKLKS